MSIRHSSDEWMMKSHTLLGLMSGIFLWSSVETCSASNLGGFSSNTDAGILPAPDQDGVTAMVGSIDLAAVSNCVDTEALAVGSKI